MKDIMSTQSIFNYQSCYFGFFKGVYLMFYFQNVLLYFLQWFFTSLYVSPLLATFYFRKHLKSLINELLALSILYHLY